LELACFVLFHLSEALCNINCAKYLVFTYICLVRREFQVCIHQNLT
jgi:hypothetical protein